MGARKLLVLHHMDVGEARLTKIIVSMTPFASSGHASTGSRSAFGAVLANAWAIGCETNGMISVCLLLSTVKTARMYSAPSACRCRRCRGACQRSSRLSNSTRTQGTERPTRMPALPEQFGSISSVIWRTALVLGLQSFDAEARIPLKADGRETLDPRYIRASAENLRKYHVKRLKQLGYDVQLTNPAAP